MRARMMGNLDTVSPMSFRWIEIKTAKNCSGVFACMCNWWLDLCHVQHVYSADHRLWLAPLSLPRTGAWCEKRRIVHAGSRCIYSWVSVTASRSTSSSSTSVSWRSPSSAAAATLVRLFFSSTISLLLNPFNSTLFLIVAKMSLWKRSAPYWSNPPF